MLDRTVGESRPAENLLGRVRVAAYDGSSGTQTKGHKARGFEGVSNGGKILVSKRPHLGERAKERPTGGAREVDGKAVVVTPRKSTGDEPEVEREDEERAKDEEIEEAEREEE